MDDLLELANAPKTFLVNGKRHQVRALSMLQLAQARAEAAASIRRERVEDAKLLASALDKHDKASFLANALAQSRASEDEVERWLGSIDGIVAVVRMALGVDAAEASRLAGDVEAHAQLAAVWRHALGIQDQPEGAAGEPKDGQPPSP